LNNRQADDYQANLELEKYIKLVYRKNYKSIKKKSINYKL